MLDLKEATDQEINSLREENSRLKAQAESQKAAVTQLQDENADLADKSKLQEETSSQLQAVMQELQKLREQIASDARDHESTLRQKDGEIQSLQADNSALTEKLESIRAEDGLIALLEEMCQDGEVEGNDDRTSQGSSNPSNNPSRASVEEENRLCLG